MLKATGMAIRNLSARKAAFLLWSAVRQPVPLVERRSPTTTPFSVVGLGPTKPYKQPMIIPSRGHARQPETDRFGRQSRPVLVSQILK